MIVRINNFKILIMVISSLSLISNYMVFKTSKVQSMIFSDLNTSIENINSDNNFFYPSLAFNTVPILTYVSEYYSDLKYFDKAIEILNKSLKINQYCLQTKYLLSRNYINTKDYKNAEITLENLFHINPSLESSSVLYISLLGELKNEEKLILIRPIIRELDNELLWNYYLDAVTRSKLISNEISVSDLKD